MRFVTAERSENSINVPETGSFLSKNQKLYKHSPKSTWVPNTPPADTPTARV